MKPLRYFLLPLSCFVFIALLFRQASAGDGNLYYFPFIANAPPIAVEFESLRTTDDSGTPQVAFLANEVFFFELSGETLYSEPITVTLEITATGPCGGLAYSDTLTLPAGAWEQDIASAAPGCTGVFTGTVQLAHPSITTTRSTTIAVVEPVQRVYTDGQGFDRCYPPTVEQMQAWWDASPYSVVNIYLGGIHYFCNDNPQDAFWVQQVAAQGWGFTGVWVGPQAPCTGYTHKISADPGQAYLEGQEEALAAAAAARRLGLFGELTLLYDVEGYSPATTSCRDAVQSFLQGWTDQLHGLGYLAGAYGGACSSYVSDWADNNPEPDQVWIAHWTEEDYDPNATVWNAVCVSDSLWADNQRIKQYAGDHSETWGGVSMTIDSNVFDTTVLSTPDGAAPARIRDFGVLGPEAGWVLAGGSVLRTDDLGATWDDVTPAGFSVTGAAFLDAERGWLAGWAQGDPHLRVARTADGGATWTQQPLDERLSPPAPVAAVYFEILDGQRLWAALKLQSGSSFSLGLLYASADGGDTWEQREHPLGAPVHFSDPLHGWTSGGPAGSAWFSTSDGGWSWEAAGPAPASAEWAGTVPAGTVQLEILDERRAWVLVQEGTCTGDKGEQICVLQETLLSTADDGSSWQAVPPMSAPRP